jgi:hypothetical protein
MIFLVWSYGYIIGQCNNPCSYNILLIDIVVCVASFWFQNGRVTALLKIHSKSETETMTKNSRFWCWWLFKRGVTCPLVTTKVKQAPRFYYDTPGFKIFFRKILKFASFLGVAHLFGSWLSKKKSRTDKKKLLAKQARSVHESEAISCLGSFWSVLRVCNWDGLIRSTGMFWAFEPT